MVSNMLRYKVWLFCWLSVLSIIPCLIFIFVYSPSTTGVKQLMAKSDTFIGRAALPLNVAKSLLIKKLFSNDTSQQLHGSIIGFTAKNGIHMVTEKLSLNEAKSILLWNPLFNDTNWGLPESTIGFYYMEFELNCPVYNCFVTSDKNVLENKVFYDAIVFHMNPLSPKIEELPKHRHVKQLYVLATRGPPNIKHNKFLNLDYNLTMTNRLDSDIPWLKYKIQEIDTNFLVAPNWYAVWPSPPTAYNSTDLFKKWKNSITRAATWLDSPCSESISRREHLIKYMEEFIPVDIYGPCDKERRCLDGLLNCQELFDRNYKFYLVFEKSLCKDVVSDELFIAMNYSMLPVVYGGADYKKFVPPHSIIDMEKFMNRATLVKLIKEVSDNPSRYLSYFWWQHKYRIVENSLPLCDICKMVFKYQKKSQSYNIKDWYYNNQCRNISRKFHQTVL